MKANNKEDIKTGDRIEKQRNQWNQKVVLWKKINKPLTWLRKRDDYQNQKWM